MDPNRQLADGEVFVLTNDPLVVNLRFRPTTEHPQRVGECMLLAGTEVATKDGILVWVKECGNEEVNHNVVVDPIAFRASLQGPMGPQGPQGLMGPQGPQGFQGPSGAPAERPDLGAEFRTKRKISTAGWIGIGLGVLAIAALAAGSGGGGKKGVPPGGHTGGAF